MSNKHYCDVCAEEIDDGYTVTWRDDIQSNGWLTAGHVSDKTEKHVCEDCWPGEKQWQGLLERLVK